MPVLYARWRNTRRRVLHDGERVVRVCEKADNFLTIARLCTAILKSFRLGRSSANCYENSGGQFPNKRMVP